MPDLPDAAVEAAARAMSVHWRDMHTNEALGRQRMLAEAALTAAAPHIAAQAAKHERGRTATAIARLIRARANATLDDRERLSGNISAGYALVFAGIWHKNALLSDDPVAAECDHLRAGIEALRDEWRDLADEQDVYIANVHAAEVIEGRDALAALAVEHVADTLRANVATLDALLRGAK